MELCVTIRIERKIVAKCLYFAYVHQLAISHHSETSSEFQFALFFVCLFVSYLFIIL